MLRMLLMHGALIILCVTVCNAARVTCVFFVLACTEHLLTPVQQDWM